MNKYLRRSALEYIGRKVGIMTFIFCILMSGFTEGQEVQGVSSEPFAQLTSGEHELLHYAPEEVDDKNREALNRIISVDLRQVPMEDALRQIAELGKLRLAYSTSVGKEYWQRPVSVQLDRATVLGALFAALDGTGLKLTLSTNSEKGQIVVDKVPEEEAQKLVPRPVQQVVTGRVTDAETGEALPGVNILVKGSTTGTTTNLDGEFQLDVPNLQETLVFSYIGFLTQEISLDGRTELEVVMEQDVMGIDELVVIGYGTQKRSDLTGALSSVDAQEFADKPVSRVDQMIAGNIPGLDVVSSGHLPGEDSEMLLRGRRSLIASNDPLIILDGMPFHGSINDINPYDVQSIDVLKDASSTAIYGSRGANGVIIITTKHGETGPPRFILESHAGPQIAYGRLPYMNAEEYAERGREALRQAGNYPDPNPNTELDEIFFDPTEFSNIQAGNSYDYPAALLQNGFQQKHQLTVMGGSEAVRYNIAGNIFNEEGLFPDRAFNRYSVSAKLDFNISERIDAGSSILLSHNKMEAKAHDGILNQAVQASPLGSPYHPDGSPRYLPTGDGFVPHPLADYEWDSFRWDNKRWAGYITAFTEVRIFPELTYRVNFGTDLSLHNIKNSAGMYSYNRRGGPPIAGVHSSVSNQNLYESIITYDKFFSNDHQLTLTGIHAIQTSREEIINSNVSELPYEEARYHNIGSAETIGSVGSDLLEWNLLSYAARAFYGYKGRYMITLSLRADGASQFAPDHKWGVFPSAAVAWNISEEKFLRNNEYLSSLRLRLSYGVSGNQAIDPYQTQGSLSRTTYAWDESAAYGYRAATLANSELKWESTETYNVGLDFGFLRGKINGNIEMYNTNTYDLIMLRLLPITTGFNQVLENIGKTNNKGFELGLNSINVDRNNFTWSSGLTFYLNREQIVELYDGKEDDIGNQWFIGYPINVYYDYNMLGIWQQDEEETAAEYNREPGQIKVEDFDASGTVNDGDRMIVGTQEPKFVANISNNFSFRNWDLGFTGYIRWGNTIYVPHFNPASGKRYNHLNLDYWTPTNQSNKHPRPDDDVQRSLQGSSQAYRDGSFIRLKHFSLGYTIPTTLIEKLGIHNMRIYISAENLWYWTKSEMREFNMEPEWTGNAGLMPATRTFTSGINVTF